MTQRQLYDSLFSGHAHRPRVLLKLLQIDYQPIQLNLAAGEQRSPHFLSLNPLGQVPTYVEGDLVLRDSTAILVYLASTYDTERQWLPTDPALAATVQAWLATASKDIYVGPCAARLNKVFGAPFDHATAVKNSHALFTTLFEPHLRRHDWLVGDHPTIADIANYGYIAAAHEGEIDISPYSALCAWLKRLEALEGFETIPTVASLLAKA